MSAALDDAALAAALTAIDPAGLGGVWLRARSGPTRDAWLAGFTQSLGARCKRIPSAIDIEGLIGGLDLAATLAAGKPQWRTGALEAARGGALVLTMAERADPAIAACIAAALDARDAFALIALDEGASPEEAPPPALLERVAFWIGLEDMRNPTPCISGESIRAARTAIVEIADGDLETLCAVAAAFGIGSVRAQIFAQRAARAHAALRGAARVAEEDLRIAARLVLAPRAITAPPEEAAAPRDAQPHPENASDQTGEGEAQGDRLVAATRAALPPGVLAIMAERNLARMRAHGAGAKARGASRGRPIAARPGRPSAQRRLDAIATLRAAAPFQRLRGRLPGGPVLLRRDDFRIRRYEQRREATSILVVDASGSSAAQRLAEAKGAVQLLLAQAYVSRARVALIAFRNAEAAMLLPPTRSLAHANRKLADLVGGGATPLAAAIDAAHMAALAERARGRTARIIFLTDGRANIGRAGDAGRAQAESDAMDAARAFRSAGFGVAFIDTGVRAGRQGEALAAALGATYAHLPYVEARGLVDLMGISRT
ncbi:MAG: VWA domain-containing protein [Alphaproteobacteria bacterium]|nr:VWA domain-containing protein [Alphaproteobacteria bacterium]